MKTFYRVLKILGITFASIAVLILGGIGLYKLSQYQQHEEMVSVVKKNEKFVKAGVAKTFKAGYPGTEVNEVYIDYDALKHHPMGGIIIKGYINNNKSYTYEVNMDKVNEDGVDPDKLEIKSGIVTKE